MRRSWKKKDMQHLFQMADCLSSLDEVIEKQKATLAAWEELKKGLLQQMFVQMKKSALIEM